MTLQQHNAAETKQFFDQWYLYQQLLDGDYMFHRSIQSALRDFVNARLNSPIKILDLGCGDASTIPGIFSDTEIQSYTGVDLSPVALERALKNLSMLSDSINLIEDDFSHYLQQGSVESFDLILIGFALHHLHPGGKREFFKQCYGALKHSGYLLLWDVFRRSGETRDAYLQAYSQQCRETWSSLSQEAIVKVLDHIQSCDFPETADTIATMASEAGFMATPKPLFADVAQFHCLFYFQKV